MKIKKLNFNDGRTKICVPILAKNRRELSDFLKGPLHEADLLEWRLDYFLPFFENNFNQSAIHILKDANDLISSKYPDMPLLLSLRSKKEGGLYSGDKESYLGIIKDLALLLKPDILDLQYSFIEGEDEIISKIKETGTLLLISYHDFEKTPSADFIVNILETMWKLGADIAKLALMAHSAEDVIRLIDASLSCKKQNKDRLMATMSMGIEGSPSRLSGRLTGSCMTFASLGKESAPGQISLPILRLALDSIEK